MDVPKGTAAHTLPLWTWPVTAVLMAAGAAAGVWLEVPDNGVIFFPPLYLGLVLVQWWGWRVIVCCYAAGVVAHHFFGNRIPDALVHALPQIVVPWLSWRLFGRRTPEGLGLADVAHLVRWLVLGFGVPVTLGTAMLVGSLIWLAPMPLSAGPDWFGAFWIGDLLGCLALTVPALMLLTGPMQRRGWVLGAQGPPPPVGGDRSAWGGAGGLAVAMVLTAVLLPIPDYWFLQGVFVLAGALRFGAAPASLLASVAVVLVAFSSQIPGRPDVGAYDTGDFNTRLGLGVLLTTALVAGRTVTDARQEAGRRRRSEDALRESEQRYRSLLGHVPDSVVEVRCDGTVVLGNRLPGGGEVSPGAAIDDCLPTALVPRLRREVDNACHSGRVVVFEQQLPAGRGMADWVLRVVPLQDDGSADRALVLCNDVTDLRRAQEEINRASKLESLGTLAGGMAHDFNTLLQTMLSTAELARRKAGEETSREAFERIARTARHAGTLTQQLLAYAGRGPLQTRPLDLARTTAAVCDLLAPAIPANVSVKQQTEPGLPPIRADESQVEQVVLNLVLNAVEAIGRQREGGVTVVLEPAELNAESSARLLPTGTTAPGRYLRLTVADDGPGLQPAAQERLFEPFFTTKPQGRGLGLSAVLGIVRAHGGGLSVHSECGRGSRFEVFWPLAAETTRAATEPAPSPPVPPSPTVDAGQRG